MAGLIDKKGAAIIISSLGYCVRFIRKDGAVPDTENYYYWNQADAAEHLQMFSDMDDPDLKEMYTRIQMLVIDSQMSIVLQEIKY